MPKFTLSDHDFPSRQQVEQRREVNSSEELQGKSFTFSLDGLSNHDFAALRFFIHNIRSFQISRARQVKLNSLSSERTVFLDTKFLKDLVSTLKTLELQTHFKPTETFQYTLKRVLSKENYCVS